MNTNAESGNRPAVNPTPPRLGESSGQTATAPSQSAKVPGSNGLRVVLAFILALGLLFVTAAVGVTGYFRLNSETAALRETVLAAIPGGCSQRVAVSVGWFTTSLVRLGSHFFSMPPEPRAALSAARGASVAVYQLDQDPARDCPQKLLLAADRTMKSRGWDRVVGVIHERECVAVYLPRKKVRLQNVRCCVLVLDKRDLVVCSAAANLDPLIKLAQAHVDMKEIRRQLAFND